MHSHEHRNGRCPRDVYSHIPFIGMLLTTHLFGVVNSCVLIEGVCVSISAWGFDVARSTMQGNAKASERGTSNEEIPRFYFIFASILKKQVIIMPTWGLVGEQKLHVMSNLLAHYTSLDAMLNIIRDDCLHFRATHFTKLNDSLEYKWPFEALKEKVKDIENLTEEKINLYYKKFPYIISLSEKKDDHLMWHLYGKCGYGVSMVLNKDFLKKDPHQQNKEFNDNNNWHVLLKMRYADEFNRLTTLNELEENYVNEGYGSVNNDFDDAFICCSFLKREDWQCEKEVRYAVIREKIMQARYNPTSESKCNMFGFEDTHNVKYYAHGNEFVPYLDVYIPKKALTAIVVGSRLDFEKNKKSIRMALKGLGTGYENVDIIKSETLF